MIRIEGRHENARLMVPLNAAQRTMIHVFVLARVERVDAEWTARPIGQARRPST